MLSIICILGTMTVSHAAVAFQLGDTSPPLIIDGGHASPAMPVDHRAIQYRPHPCQDGRFSDGRPRSCEELMRWLEDDDRPFLHGHPSSERDVPHPCIDGRFSDGRARSCSELMRWLHRAH